MALLAHYEAILREAGEACCVLELQSGMRALFTQRGARMLGLFPGPDEPNLLWTHSALNDLVAFREFVSAGEWNLGGERCWIAPEIQYNVGDRRDFWGTLHVPPAMDPGGYRLTASSNAVRFEAEMTLKAHNLATGEKQLRVVRMIRPTESPLPVPAGVQFAGLAHTASLTELNQSPAMSAIWNLVQLPAGGRLFIPTVGRAHAARYFGDPAPDSLDSRDGCVQIALDGSRQYKVGYHTLSVAGRMAYWRELADGRTSLLVRGFPNDPANSYVEEPPDHPGANGHAIHVYNDGGEFGGTERFGEMECSGHTIGGRTDVSSSTDTFYLWVYVGAADVLRPLAQALSGALP